MRDDFDGRSSKLAALLGIPQHGRVLLVGDALEHWVEEFDAYFDGVLFVGSLDALNRTALNARKYDLAVAASGRRASSALWEESLRRIAGVLDPNGSFVMFAGNRYSIHRDASGTRRLVNRGMLSSRGYRSVLRRAGFRDVKEFLPLPSASSPEEYQRTASTRIDLPVTAPALLRILNKVRLYPLVHDGFAYVATRRAPAFGALLRHIHSVGMRGSDFPVDRLRVDRFSLRERGALVVTLSGDYSGGERLVCRLTSAGAAGRVVRRNLEWTQRISESDRLPDTIRARVPRPLGEFRVERNIIGYLEEFVDGVISWKLAGVPRVEGRLFESTYAFIRDFTLATAESWTLNEGLLARLVERSRAVGVDPRTSEILGKLCELLWKRLLHQDRIVTWSHGDFGYGNVLAEPGSGRLTGVIDWDQAGVDLAGVDVANFLVQRRRMIHEEPLAIALSAVIDPLICGGFREVDSRLDLDVLFPWSRSERIELTAVVALRFAERTMKYPAIFAASRDEVRSVLQTALMHLSADERSE